MSEPNGTIVYTCPYVPAEWIVAHGLQPQRLIPQPREGVSIAARAEGLCPYARAFANDAMAESPAGIVVTTLCDQMRRVHDLLVRGSGVPVFLLNVPKTWQTVAAQRLYVDELKRLGRFLVRLGGRTPTRDELAQAMTDAGCGVLSNLVSGVARPNSFGCVLRMDTTGRESTVKQSLTVAPKTNILFQQSAIPGPPACYTPVAVVGGPLMQRDRILFELIEECGGRVVLDATETGRRGLRRAFDHRRLAENPLMELADAYFSIPDASRRPNRGLYRWLKEELTRTDAKGIVFHHYLWCDAWRAELVRLKEWAGLPVLGLDSDGHTETNLARLRTRIRAFLEMLQ